MKKSIILLLLCLALALTGCAGKADYAIKVGDWVITENDYSRAINAKRSNHLSYNETAEDTKAYWTAKLDENQTLSEAIVEEVQEHLIETKLYAVQFDKLGLSFTTEEDTAIQTALSETVDKFGGLSKFNAYLKEIHYTYDEFLTEQYDTAKKSKVLSYYYGADGKTPVKLQDIKDYYNVHNALIKMAIILKVDDDTGEALEEKALKEAAQKAEDAYAAAIAPSDIDTFEDVIGVYSAYRSDTDSMVVNADNAEETVLEEILAMKVGEVKKIEAEDSYYIIKRYDGTADDVFTSTLRLETLETIRADEIDAMLAEWKADTDVKINKKLIKKYRPENMIAE